jgi:hypothetical protein
MFLLGRYRTSFGCLAVEPGLILQAIQNLFLHHVSFSFCYGFMFIEQVVVQTTRFVDRSKRRSRQMELQHVVENFRIDSFQEYIGFELALGRSHTEGNVVSRANILVVVQATAGTIAPMPYLGRRSGGCHRKAACNLRKNTVTFYASGQERPRGR